MAPRLTSKSDPLLPHAQRRADALRAAEWVWYTALSLGLVVVTIAAVSAAAAVNPRFCATCHATQAQQLAASPHQGTTCDNCHSGSGGFDLLENRLWVAGMVLESPVRAVFPTNAKAHVDSQRCVACHKPQMHTTSVRHGIRMNHNAPLTEGWSCTRCHRSAGHGEAGTSLASYTMGTCLECHSTGGALSGCTTCHPEGQQPSAPRATRTAWGVTHGANWESAHGMGDLTSCTACHPKDYCVRCHELELPHSPNYLSEHGEDVSALGEAACATCHREASCLACHGGVEMPHPDEFLSEHKQAVDALGKEACDRCHAEESCESCHARHTHPGLSAERLKELQDRPVKVK